MKISSTEFIYKYRDNNNNNNKIKYGIYFTKKLVTLERVNK